MNVLVIGSGGREHAIAWALSKSPSVENLFISPGNFGTGRVGTNVDLDIGDFASVRDFARANGIDLVVVGPENPLAGGIADFLRDSGISVFGPGARGARLESSKSYAKEFMARHGIPHPRFWVFDDAGEAASFISTTEGPWVIKADGLALGKGVTVCFDREEALDVARSLMSGKALGNAGKKIVIEEFLRGRELTAMALSDGKTLYPLPFARDHKRAFDGDEGPMTGGMGAYSPVTDVDQKVQEIIIRDILEKTLCGLKEEGIDYRGILYAGLMLTRDGPKVLEYNVRFGDPEAQCILPRLEGDLALCLRGCAEGSLDRALGEAELRVKPETCVTVIMASGGYPGTYEKGVPISGIESVEKEFPENEVMLFFAGAREENGEVVTAGGRVLAVTALAASLPLAREKAYNAAKMISFRNAHYRKDIGRMPATIGR
ncbi:MAG TPA: phosphoribosylamine--glycine ligase [Firmicutes bacterium]|nr:phosphoribosylamine--glycine ligase [Candidatus Fermentithermobacillaceae bacterium]